MYICPSQVLREERESGTWRIGSPCRVMRMDIYVPIDLFLYLHDLNTYDYSVQSMYNIEE